jgi:3-oxoacyl-[acyl-carrier-protein] synthase II
MNRRVVVTGMSGISPLGSTWGDVSNNLREGRSGVSAYPELSEIDGMGTCLAARVEDFETPKHFPRKSTRNMGRVSLLAARATELALQDALLIDSPLLGGGRTGVSYGSTSGSPPAMETYFRLLSINSVRGIRPTDYVQLMSHTVPANLSQLFGVRGRIIPTCSACTSGSQGIGYGLEAIQGGRQDIMICGGAEEFHSAGVAVFDVMFATSSRNDAPHTTPRPFDRDRDGLVVGEGASTLILEELEHARRRGAPIYAEVLSFGTNGDGKHITNPDSEGMRRVMELALGEADLAPDQIDYVNAHGTATEVGDIAESLAMNKLFGTRVPTSSLKSYLGHTLGACGALEAWASIEMMREGWLAPTLNLDVVDPRCGELDYIRGGIRAAATEIVMSNNFAFGGVNTSLIFRRWDD